MFAIKSKNKYLVRCEDDISINFNLVSDKSAASTFDSREEAQQIGVEAQVNAQNELHFLETLPMNEAIALEYESVSDQFLNLTVVAV